MDYRNGKLKNIDVFFKINSLQCSWLRQLFHNSFHQWKVIPLFFVNKTFNPFKHFNLFVPSAPFLYPPENRVQWERKKGAMGMNGLNSIPT